jgi:hypothetical protein
MMHERGKSDSVVVAEKPANKAEQSAGRQADTKRPGRASRFMSTRPSKPSLRSVVSAFPTTWRSAAWGLSLRAN